MSAPSAAGWVDPDFFAALDRAPMTWRHYFYWLVASGGAFLDGFSVVALGVALPLMKRDLALSPLLVGLLGSALVLGAVASAWIGGILADRFGRKKLMVADMAVIAAAAGLAAVAPNAWIVALAQFLTGVGVGADFPTSAAYISEMTPRAARSRMTVATIAMQSVGMVSAALAALAILKLHPGAADWRWMLGAAGAVAALFLVARLFAPDSVRWLATRGRIGEARALLRDLAVDFDDTRLLTASIPAAALHAPAARKPRDGGIGMLFGRRYRMRTLLAAVPWMLMDVATYGVGLFTPVILGAMHIGGLAGAGLLRTDVSDAEGSALVDLFLLFGFLASLYAVPRFGRIPMQLAGFSGMTLGMSMLLAAALMGGDAPGRMALVIGGFVLFNFAMNAGPNATTFAIAPSLFPTAMRASAGGFAAASAKIGATFGTFVVPQLHAAWGLAGVVGLMMAASAAGLVSTAALEREVNEEGALDE